MRMIGQPSVSPLIMSQALLVGFDAPTLAFCAGHLAGHGIETKSATSLTRARELLRGAAPVFCIVDGDLASGEAFRIVDLAREARVPVALAGGAAAAWDERSAQLLHLEKPLTRGDLDRIIAAFRSRPAQGDGRPLIVGE